ncbi:hypothetical protein D3C84_1159620 [compost metagenome]
MTVELFLELLTWQAICTTGTLHHCPTGCAFAAHEQRNADQTLVSDHGDFC